MYEIETKSKEIITDAIRAGATDVHFIPVPDGCFIQYRIRGETNYQQKLNSHIAERLVSHFKYQSGMDIGERRKPQSTSMKVNIENTMYDLRISTLPTRMMESLAIRILPQEHFITLSQLPLFPNCQRKLEAIAQINQGLCLITGPTGSGKTTTLYALLEQILLKRNRTIITIEDPIERQITQTIQMEVNQKAGLTFDSGLRAALRHDPDVILVGEIRDKETALLAVRAALTGHLVIASLHSSNCYQAVLRMIDYGVSKLNLYEACQTIFSQRLVVKSCIHCHTSSCSNDLQHKRTALYEWLDKKQLRKVIMMGENPTYSTLKCQAKKAWSLGYITSSGLMDCL